MSFSLPAYLPPDFDAPALRDAPEAALRPVERDTVAPDGFHAMSIYPEYFLIGGQWRLPFGGAIYVPEYGWFPPDGLIRGLSYLEGIPQLISPGLGSDPHYENMPGRIFNAPTVTLITLSRKAVR